VRVPTAIALSLAALDTLTQRILALSLCPEEVGDAPISTPTPDAPADLAPTPTTGDRPPEHRDVSPGLAAAERGDR
jgi:hypothetical protein